MEESTKPHTLHLNIKGLPGEPTHLNLSNVPHIQGEFQKRGIKAPDNFSFDHQTVKAILEGFTEGALKNIITISEDKIRLYKVTLASIELLSISEIEFQVHNPSIVRLISNSAECSVQLFQYTRQVNKSIIIRFDFRTGALLTCEEFVFWEQQNICYIQDYDIPRPKNSQIDRFVTSYIYTRSKSSGRSPLEIGRLRKSKYFRWMHFGAAIRNKFAETKRRFDEQVSALREEIRPNFRLKTSSSKNLFKYSEEMPHLTLMVAGGKMAFSCFLVDLRIGKVLKSTSFTLIDLLGEKGIEEILRDPLPGDAMEQAFVGFDDHQFAANFMEYVYLPSTCSFVLLARVRNLDLIIKIDDPFSADSFKNLTIVKKRMLSQGNRIIRVFGSDRIMTYYSGEVRSTYLRPLAWLNPDFLQETKIKGLEESGRSHLLFRMGHFSIGSYAKLSQNRILVLNKFLAFIYDFELDRPITEQFYCFQRYGNRKFMNLGDLYIGSEPKHIYMLKTKRDEEGKEEIVKNKIIHLNDLVPNLSLGSESFGFNAFKLTNGNYLYVGSKYLEEDVKRSPHNPTCRLFSAEIDQETLSVVRYQVVLPEKLHSHINGENIHYLNNLLIFNAKLKKEKILEERGHQDEEEPQEERTEPDYSSSLILASTNFKVLDHCTSSKLRVNSAIKAASANRIASLGQENQIYLHEIDFVKEKLTLIKTVILDSYQLSGNHLRMLSSSSFCCLVQETQVRQGENQEKMLLKFDMDLELVRHLRLRGASDMSSIYPLRGNKVCFVERESQNISCLFVMDLENRAVRLAHRHRSAFTLPNYVREDGSEGKVMCMEMVGEKIIKILLE